MYTGKLGGNALLIADSRKFTDRDAKKILGVSTKTNARREGGDIECGSPLSVEASKASKLENDVIGL